MAVKGLTEQEKRSRHELLKVPLLTTTGLGSSKKKQVCGSHLRGDPEEWERDFSMGTTEVEVVSYIDVSCYPSGWPVISCVVIGDEYHNMTRRS